MSSRSLISENFLLENSAAQELYHHYAVHAPIFDYHCHLPPEQIANNYQFGDLAEVWLGGDHYKWRAMRLNGVAERYCTGDASPREKHDAWVATVPYTLRNPLYHWSHLELNRYFGIDLPISPATGEQIWHEANPRLAELRTHDILKKFEVAVICTTDDPADPLDSHEKIRASSLPTRVYPTFRPDKAMALDDPAAFNRWREKLEQTSGTSINTLDDLLAALRKRHDAFHAIGGRLSDHGLNQTWSEPCTETEAAATFLVARAGTRPSAPAIAKYSSYLLREFGRWDAKRGWTKQLHLGALRNSNTRGRLTLGADTGFDGIGDFPQAESLIRYLDSLESTGELPKMVIYNVNPADNYVLASAIASFTEAGIKQKVQFGSGWWFLDQQEAMEWQLNALSNLGLLRRFVGMLTDSRSFLSYPRHEYFRRTLCNLLGRDLARGALPADIPLIGSMVKEICFGNAKNFFGLELDASFNARD